MTIKSIVGPMCVHETSAQAGRKMTAFNSLSQSCFPSSSGGWLKSAIQMKGLAPLLVSAAMSATCFS